jgi:hypothetical protein
MITYNILTDEIINYILQLKEVLESKQKINTLNSGSVNFNISTTQDLYLALKKYFNLDIGETIPMRWIKGDTPSHIDKGVNSFKNTHLIYLTDSDGEFIINSNSYPIKKGTGYIFEQGTYHETINTGTNPRLLLGPMSETGLAVGGASTITADGATETIYFKYFIDTTAILYKINDGSYDSFSLPITIVNSNTSSTLKVLFENGIPILNYVFYFICGSDSIQFGSASLQNDGTRPIITIDAITGYEGLIKNGDSFGNGYNNIYIYNLDINTINDSTLTSNSGWFGREYFAKGANNCYIINCSSNGPIIDAGGGIVGGYAGSNNGNLQIIGCSSSGNSGTYSGGIVGYYAAQTGGNVICTGCWSTGIIGVEQAGGIFGYGAGDTLGSVTATNCYSTGLINPNGGGIFGREAATNSGVANAVYCYSRGIISSNAGGIFGSNAGLGTTAQNCYSTGTITTLGNGIYGTNAEDDVVINCYAANGIWNTATANARLSGTPVSPSVIGTTWVATTINQPYEIVNFGYTPYLTSVISANNLIKTYSQTIQAGNSTNSSIKNDLSGNYIILEITGGDIASRDLITMNGITGAITAPSSTVQGTYTIYLRSIGSYNITTFTLTVLAGAPQPNIPCLTEDTIILTPNGYVKIDSLRKNDFVLTDDNRIIKIVEIFEKIVKCTIDTYPCIVPKNSIAENYPQKDFKISQGHLIKYGNTWILPKNKFKLDTKVDQIKYYHIQLENYKTDHLVINNGVVVESFGKKFSDSVEYCKRINILKKNSDLELIVMY